jgi:hypothetical protein
MTEEGFQESYGPNVPWLVGRLRQEPRAVGVPDGTDTSAEKDADNRR